MNQINIDGLIRIVTPEKMNLSDAVCKALSQFSKSGQSLLEFYDHFDVRSQVRLKKRADSNRITVMIQQASEDSGEISHLAKLQSTTIVGVLAGWIVKVLNDRTPDGYRWEALGVSVKNHNTSTLSMELIIEEVDNEEDLNYAPDTLDALVDTVEGWLQNYPFSAQLKLDVGSMKHSNDILENLLNVIAKSNDAFIGFRYSESNPKSMTIVRIS